MKIKTVTVVGLGVIGMSWAAYYLARGFDVRGYDPAPGAFDRTRAYIVRAWADLEALGLVADGASPDRIAYVTTLEDALADCDFVQENGPEVEDLKIEMLAAIDALVRPEVIIASSTSALPISRIQAGCRSPERVLVGHPFNPPHLVPLVEIVGGRKTAPERVEEAMRFYAEIGRKPVLLKREVYGHIANRLQYALFNEAARLALEGVASVEDIDAAVHWGPGMRWSAIGPFMTLHLGGGAAGMAGTFAKFSQRDTANTDRSARMSFSADQQKMLIDGVEAAADGRSVGELEAERDRHLIGLYALKARAGEG